MTSDDLAATGTDSVDMSPMMAIAPATVLVQGDPPALSMNLLMLSLCYRFLF